MNTTWSRVKRNSQYQWEEVYNWASYLEYSQSIEFDADRAPEKPDLIRFFGEGRQLLVGTAREKTRQLGRTSRKRPSTSLPYSSHLYFSRFENSKAFDKETWKEKKKKQRWLKHKRAQNNFGSIFATNVNTHNVVTTPGRARKALSQINCFNYIEKEHYPRNYSKLKRDRAEE